MRDWRSSGRDAAQSGGNSGVAGLTPGKRTLTADLPSSPHAPAPKGQIPLKGAEAVQARADEGVAGVGQPIPHLARIQAQFGRHDVSGVSAFVGGAAAAAADDIGAEA